MSNFPHSSLELDIFIKNERGDNAKGVVWPGGTYFPDFSSPKAYKYWSNQIQDLYEKGIKFDGIWIDMNEPSSFVDGSDEGSAVQHK
jgi:alpha-glucosidase (family GH31 glycosyl hydrolase)